MAWHERAVTSKHQQWFRGLNELHQITQAWIAELQLERPSHALARGLSREASENLWMLDSVNADMALDALLDDTTPDDVLARLERTVWSVQAWTLMKLLERTAESEKNALLSMLQQIAWRIGRKSAEARWSRLPRETRNDLRPIFLTLGDSPFTGSRNHRTLLDSFLVRRAVGDEVELELLACPHRVSHSEVKPVADELCRIQTHFLRGFVYVINSKVSIEARERKPAATPGDSADRCSQRWFFVS